MTIDSISSLMVSILFYQPDIDFHKSSDIISPINEQIFIQSLWIITRHYYDKDKGEAAKLQFFQSITL